jgi:hypothetical protein
MPFTHVNGSTLPRTDEALKADTPKADDPEYATKIIEFVRDNAPDDNHHTCWKTSEVQSTWLCGAGQPIKVFSR